jgi:hypothetical protein
MILSDDGYVERFNITAAYYVELSEEDKKRNEDVVENIIRNGGTIVEC